MQTPLRGLTVGSLQRQFEFILGLISLPELRSSLKDIYSFSNRPIKLDNSDHLAFIRNCWRSNCDNAFKLMGDWSSPARSHTVSKTEVLVAIQSVLLKTADQTTYNEWEGFKKLNGESYVYGKYIEGLGRTTQTVGICLETRLCLKIADRYS